MEDWSKDDGMEREVGKEKICVHQLSVMWRQRMPTSPKKVETWGR